MGVNGNVSVDPRFMSRAPVTLNLRLQPTSPLIDAGDNAEAPAWDLDGVPRVLDGNGDGQARIDLGAYELGDLDGDGIPDWQDADDDADGVADGTDCAPRARGVSSLPDAVGSTLRLTQAREPDDAAVA